MFCLYSCKTWRGVSIHWHQTVFFTYSMRKSKCHVLLTFLPSRDMDSTKVIDMTDDFHCLAIILCVFIRHFCRVVIVTWNYISVAKWILICQSLNKRFYYCVVHHGQQRDNTAYQTGVWCIRLCLRRKAAPSVHLFCLNQKLQCHTCHRHSVHQTHHHLLKLKAWHRHLFSHFQGKNLN